MDIQACLTSLVLLLMPFSTYSFPMDDLQLPPPVCEYNGKQYQLGEPFNKGCDEKCVCSNFGGFAMSQCSPMCDIVGTMCDMIPNPNANVEAGTDCCHIKDPDCKDCFFESPRGSGNVVNIPAGEIKTFPTEWCRCNTDGTATCGPLGDLPSKK